MRGKLIYIYNIQGGTRIKLHSKVYTSTHSKTYQRHQCSEQEPSKSTIIVH